ncbi:MAG: OPT family oligopeptide transporter [Acidobacteriota bacterium]
MSETEFRPYVPSGETPPELTMRAIILGVIMAIILGFANAYLGIRAGQTVAATFPAAVVAMAFLRVFKGNILEENIARTTASVGEALVAGAIFTIPAFILAGIWTEFDYVESTMLMLAGGLLGVLFVVLLRRSLVGDRSLPFPESVAAAEIHKAGQKGQTGAQYLFYAMGLGALIELLKNSKGIQLFHERITGFWTYGSFNSSISVGGATFGSAAQPGAMPFSTPAASPAYLGVGYIIGPRLGSITFAGGVFAWWFMIPVVLFFNPEFADSSLVAQAGGDWDAIYNEVWRSLVRPIAVGAMIVGALWTLLRMRKSLVEGIGKSISDLKAARAGEKVQTSRIDRDLPFNWTAAGVVALIIPITFLYYYFSGQLAGAFASAIVMVIAGFFFSAVAGYLVGVIGSSSNPISGLTLSTLLLAALLMTSIGVKGAQGVAAVLGVAAVVCCACAIAGDMLQDLKVGHLLGGTPWRMQIGEIIGVVAAALLMTVPMIILHEGDIKAGGQGIGGSELPAPQAGLMALLAQGIVGGEMAWPLVVFGMAFCLMLLLVRAPSPMLIAVGMYLPLQTTSAIFVGGIIRWIFDLRLRKLGNVSEEERSRGENTGTLLASGFIAGEALMGVLLSGLILLDITFPQLVAHPSGWLGLVVFALLGWIMVQFPLAQARSRG